MFKILDTTKRSTCLRNNITRYFANYCDTGEYHFLDKFNYVGNYGIHWTHPQSSFIIRVTDDYQKCFTGNQLNDDNTCWWYFPKKVLSTMKNDFNERDVFDIENELRNWKLSQTAPESFFKWSLTLARCYAIFTSVPLEQKLFATKQFVSTFCIDDSIEKLNSNREFSAAGDELFKNLWFAVSGKFDQITDMNKFKGRNNVPDCYIENAIRSIDIQTEMIKLAKQLLKPKIYDLFVSGCHDYLNGVRAETVFFQKHCPLKTSISEQEGKTVRFGASGIKWILPTMMTDEKTAIHLNLLNPIVDMAVLISILENDLIGYFRDKSNDDFTPMSFFQPNKLEQSESEAAKLMASRFNEAKKVFEYVCENVPPENCKHYEYLGKYIGFVIDYNFVSRLRHTNSRYGWIPQLD